MIWRDGRGVFEAEVGALVVRGWSSTVEDMAALLARYGVAASELADAAVSPVVAAAEWDHVRAGKLERDAEDWHTRLRAVAVGPERQVLRGRLGQLRNRIPAEPTDLAAWLGEQTEQVNATAPQVGEVAVFDGKGSVGYEPSREPEACSECLCWVDPRAIVSTPDRRWGDFDRMEAGRRSLVGFCETLRVADTAAALEEWIDDFTIGRLRQPVRLIRVEGPAGPVYVLRADGTHRAHFARVFGLPLLALVRTSALPRPLHVTDRPDIPGVDRFSRWGALWGGLRKHGLLEVEGDPEPAWFARWTPTRLCAEWMLLPPSAAVEVNRAYDRVYPGALEEATGLPAEVLFDAQRWARTMVGDAPPAVRDQAGRILVPRLPPPPSPGWHSEYRQPAPPRDESWVARLRRRLRRDTTPAAPDMITAGPIPSKRDLVATHETGHAAGQASETGPE
ncbi:hypothetical protein [Nocardia sp. NPDC047648]|uniref:hypothetical protein n=1 Tax=Nocardia sp. NPDC047648 TaxID=3155625 RepID=UPI0033DC6682